MFKRNELLKATAGKLISAGSDTVIKGISIDSRTIKKNEAFIAIKGNNFDGHDFMDEAIKKGASCIIGKSLRAKRYPRRITLIEVQDTTKALGDIARMQRHKFNLPVIAITGSNGKTTTKEMIAWVLSVRFHVLKNEGTKNNQIGLPLALLKLKGLHDIAVLEIGTNHFGEVKTLAQISGPNIGIITNIGPAHLEYFNNLKGVFREKSALIKNLQTPYIAILNTDDQFLSREVKQRNKNPFTLGLGIKNTNDFFASDIKCVKEGLEFSVNLKYKFTLKTLGLYNIYNALAAIAVARIFGMEYKDIISRLFDFEFPQSRLKLKQLNKTRFIDDTYNSNPVSLKQALNTLNNFKTKGRKIFIMGDMLELGEQEKLFHYQAGCFAARVCDAFITVGKLSKMAAKAAKDYGLNSKYIFTCTDSYRARDILFNKISPGKDDIVLIKGSRLMKMEEIFK